MLPRQAPLRPLRRRWGEAAVTQIPLGTGVFQVHRPVGNVEIHVEESPGFIPVISMFHNVPIFHGWICQYRNLPAGLKLEAGRLGLCSAKEALLVGCQMIRLLVDASFTIGSWPQDHWEKKRTIFAAFSQLRYGETCGCCPGQDQEVRTLHLTKFLHPNSAWQLMLNIAKPWDGTGVNLDESGTVL